MKQILFVNDSYFTYLLAKPLIEKYHNSISLVVFSTRINRSISAIKNVYKKTYIKYFAYRLGVELFSRYLGLFKGESISCLVKRYNLRYIMEADVNRSALLEEFLPANLGLAFNFDQIIKKPLDSFPLGVINIHGSKLPDGKGISPVLWAFARGDNSIWVTIYRMDEGIDTGSVYHQFEVRVKGDDTAFSLYKKVCQVGGIELLKVVNRLSSSSIETKFLSEENAGNYWGWPNAEHKKMMLNSNKRFLSLRDVLRVLIS